MLTWYPDFCPPGGQCVLQVDQGQNNLITAITYCPHHASLKAGGLTDAQTFSAIVQSSRVKEIARWEAKQELMDRGLATKDGLPGVPYTVAANGNFTIQPGGSGQVKNAIRARITTALQSVEQPQGTSTVTVA